MKCTQAECLGFLYLRCCDSGAQSCSGVLWVSDARSGPPNATAFDLHAGPGHVRSTCALHARAKVCDFLEQSAQVVAKSVLWSVSSGLP